MRSGWEAPVRLAVLALVIVLLAGCSHDAVRPPPGAEMSAAALAKTCADPNWKKQNLGLWYSVCRRPMHW
jgi:outer membrane biogenesis lipoprotein LolB